MPILRLPPDLREMCTAIARAALPNEACALVAGRRQGADAVVTAIHPVANSSRSPTKFSMNGLEMIAAEHVIDERGDDLIGVLHSHPASEAYPSERDFADARGYDPRSEFVQLIVSLQGFSPTLRAFRYGSTGSDTIEFVIEPIRAP